MAQTRFVSRNSRGGNRNAYRSCVDAAVLSAGHDVALADNPQTLGEGLVLGGRITSDDGRDGLHLLRLELKEQENKSVESPLHSCRHRGVSHIETGRGGPDTVASGADDGGLVNMTGANQATQKPPSVSHFVWINRRNRSRSEWVTSCRYKLRRRGTMLASLFLSSALSNEVP